MRTTTLIALAALCPLAAAQEAGFGDDDNGIPVLSVDEIALSHYAVQYVSPYELYELAHSMVGREYHLKERGGIYSPSIDNLSVLGQQVVIYDTPAYAKRVLDMLSALDRVPEETPEPVEEYVTAHLTPNYVSLETYERALRPYMRELPSGWNNLSEVRERRTLVVRDTVERIAEMKQVVAGIDVPDRQVLVTCYLLRGRPGASAAGLAPKELTANLERLLPDLGFELLGFSMLQAGMASDRTVKLGIQSSEGGEFGLSFQPVAYDEASGSITARRCEVMAGNQVLLSTDTVLRGDQYTVLGATGREPLFFVVHVRAWDLDVGLSGGGRAGGR